MRSPRHSSRRPCAWSAGGADFIILAANSPHNVAPAIEEALSIPFLHIADATGSAIQNAGLETVGLLGSRFTMEMGFVRDRLKRRAITALVPDEEERVELHRIVFEELVHGKFLPESKRFFLEVMEGLKARGAQGIILGCTEFGILVKQEDFDLPMFDTAKIHAEAAIQLAL